MKKRSAFLAGVIGALAGALGGLLLAPKSGKETRKEVVLLANELAKRLKTKADETKLRIKTIFGKYTDEGIEKYNEINSALIAKVAEVKKTGKEIDKEKYEKVVETVVEEFKGDLTATKESVSKLKKYLKSDWLKIKKVLT
jgi:gas vesicle protein